VNQTRLVLDEKALPQDNGELLPSSRRRSAMREGKRETSKHRPSDSAMRPADSKALLRNTMRLRTLARERSQTRMRLRTLARERSQTRMKLHQRTTSRLQDPMTFSHDIRRFPQDPTTLREDSRTFLRHSTTLVSNHPVNS
jgi:hypothetical protein